VGTMNLLAARVAQRGAQEIRLDVQGLGELRLPVSVESPAWAQSLSQTERGAATGAEAGPSAWLSCRPHTLRLDVVDASPDARYLWMPGRVDSREFLGEFTRYRVAVGPQSLAVDHPHHAGLSRFEPGCAVSLGLDPSQLRLLPA
jgi:iron(III) transport system ATP-binding protein